MYFKNFKKKERKKKEIIFGINLTECNLRQISELQTVSSKK